MAVLKHTITCPIEEYPIDLVLDLGMTQTQLNTARAAGSPCPALVDIENWSADLGDKPAFPLTEAALMDLPFVLVGYLASDEAIGDALRDYMETRRPNSKRRSATI
jgi:hypothetical protein